MPFYTYRVLENNTSLDDSGVKDFDLPASGWLTSLDIRLIAKNTDQTGGNVNNPQFAKYDWFKVIVDGTTEVKALDGRAALGFQVYNDASMPIARWSERVSEVVWFNTRLDFGRYPGDPVYGLQLDNHSNPKFQLDWNLDIPSSDANDNYLTSYHYIYVTAHILEDMPGTPAGYIKSRRSHSETFNTQKDYRLELDIPHEYRRIMVNAQMNGYEIWDAVSRAKIDVNTGAFYPYDQFTKEILHDNAQFYELGGLRRNIRGMSKTNSYIETDSFFGFIDGWGANCYSPAMRSIENFDCSGNYLKGRTYDNAGSVANSVYYNGVCAGWAPFSTWMIPFEQFDDQSWWDTEGLGDLDLILTAAGCASVGSGFTCKVYPEELIRY